VNPVTGERALGRLTVRTVLTTMASCGMYDGAGAWLHTVGLPAKSGVGGGIIAVLPGQLGIAVFSPPLDRHGNSVRGVAVCRDLSQELDLHLVRSGRRGAPPVRSSYTLAEAGSTRRRSAAEQATLTRQGAEVIVLELQGDLEFQAAEVLTRRLDDAASGRGTARARYAVLDLERVDEVHGAVVPLLTEAAAALDARGGSVVLSGVAGHEDLVVALGNAARRAGRAAPEVFEELDLALEWCEDQLTGTASVARGASRVELADHELLVGMSAVQVGRVEAHARPRRYQAGDLVFCRGEDPTEVLLVTSGHLSVLLELSDGRSRRVATVAGGMLVGELALASGGPRTADVRADTDVEGVALSATDLAELRAEEPELATTLLLNVVRIVAERADRIRRQRWRR
jgi:glutaminase